MPDEQNDKSNRKQPFPVGIAGVSIQEMDREVAPEDPPAWPINEKLSVVGKPATRIDGRQKVTGAAKYTADMNLPGMLFARMIVSPYPAASITSIDTSAAEKMKSVKAIHLMERNLGPNAEPKAGESKY